MKKKRDSKLWINKVIRGGGGGAAAPSRFSPSSGAATGISVCAPGQGPAGQAGVWLLRNSSGSHMRGQHPEWLTQWPLPPAPPPPGRAQWSRWLPLHSMWPKGRGVVSQVKSWRPWLPRSSRPAIPPSLPSSSASRLFQQTKAPRGQGPRGRALRVPFIWISFQNRGLPSDSSGGTEFCRKQTWTWKWTFPQPGLRWL